MLAGAGWDGRLSLWESSTGQELCQMTGHQQRVHSLAFGADGHTIVSADAQTVRLWESATGREAQRFEDKDVDCAAFSRVGRLVAVGGAVPRVWSASPRAVKSTGLRRAEREQFWADLAAEDAALAQRATWALAADPEASLVLLKERLRPVAGSDLERVPQLLAALDDDRFTVREGASRDLEKLGPAAGPPLRRALDASPSVEARRRIEVLLAVLEQSRPRPSAWQLREVRALAVLEQIDSREARQLLEALARGVPDARLTQEAKASLQRLNRR